MRLFLRILYTTLFISNINFGISQEIDFHTPIDTPFDLSGTFGEFRSRFHTGIDFKSRGVQGQKIFSIEDGYVSRIEVNNYGYGKVIYIDHFNGFTSVYAHLKNFSPELDEYIKSEPELSMNQRIQEFSVDQKSVYDKEDPNSCHICQISFHQKKHYIAHITHLYQDGTKSFKCCACNKKCPSENGIRSIIRHI